MTRRCELEKKKLCRGGKRPGGVAIVLTPDWFAEQGRNRGGAQET